MGVYANSGAKRSGVLSERKSDLDFTTSHSKELRQLIRLLRIGTVSLTEVLAVRESYSLGVDVSNLQRRLHWSKELMTMVLKVDIDEIWEAFEERGEK